MFKATDSRGRSVLAMAARGGSHDVFLQALKVFKNEFTDDQVCYSLESVYRFPPSSIHYYVYTLYPNLLSRGS